MTTFAISTEQHKHTKNTTTQHILHFLCFKDFSIFISFFEIFKCFLQDMLSNRIGTVNDCWGLKPVLSNSKPHTFLTLFW